MYHVFLDTNLFVSNFQFSSKDNTKLLKYASRGDVKLYLTYTNYREILKKFKDQISPIIKNMKSANAEFSKHSGDLLIDHIKKPKDYTEMYKSFLDKLIEDNYIKVIKHTNDFSSKIIDKYFDNEKPFDINKPSFQDAIIWETIVDFYNNEFDEIEERIFFLTRNIKDFAKEGNPLEDVPHTLHGNLQDEAPQLVIYKDTEEFFKMEEDNLHDYLIDSFELEEEKAIRIIEEFAGKSTKIDNEIEYFLSNNQFEGEYFSGWGEDSYGRIDDIIILDASKDIETNIVEINCSIEYEVEFTIVDKSPVYDFDDPDDLEYMRDGTGSERIAVNSFIKMLNNEIIELSINDLEII
ncbi:hypothetical protein COM71_24400 [Priestia megaterium]|uniref:PIN domain-containing protein n=1 Tax=Priestia megaterium TaxID=1404 RepID=UPI000BEDDDA4|nr:PIN domain-containing protein [Priestia megaterium]PEE43859.1 hypothetical protein COM71_24400 [Priestia megaterium]